VRPAKGQIIGIECIGETLMSNGSSGMGASGCRQLRSAWRPGRRQILQAGLLGFAGTGLGLPQLWAAEKSSAASQGGGFGRAKRCIFLFMWGGPSQLDTFDMKPQAPPEVRGEFHPIATSVPGLQICEHFQRLAPLMDRVAIVRSLHHDDPAHLSSGHTTLTGQLPPVNRSDAEPPSDRDTPHFGCVMSHLRPAPPVLPSFVTIPWQVAHPAAPGGQAPGQHGGWLGHKYDPFVVAGDPSHPSWQVPSLALTDGVSSARMRSRRELLRGLDDARARLDSAAVTQADHLQHRAFELLSSTAVRTAFDLEQEPASLRDTYGRHLHGQCVLLARRLVEQGVPIVTVNWHNDGRNFWDTHGDNFRRLKYDLIPPADQALAALLLDLEQRGLLDETLVVWIGEFGRKPQITAATAGREHWPFCYSGLLAGGGIRGGAVYGSSDKFAAYPVNQPVSPHDLVATIYHALGVPQSQMLVDTESRPRAVYGGAPIGELFG
jgi:hypothetical protein